MIDPEIREPAESRGGEDPDWERVAPGKPLDRKPGAETQGGDREPPG